MQGICFFAPSAHISLETRVWSITRGGLVVGWGWEEFSSLTKTAIMRCFPARFAAPCWMVAKMFTSSVLGEKERKYSKKALWQLYGKAAEKENRDEDKRWYANHYTMQQCIFLTWLVDVSLIALSPFLSRCCIVA